MSIASSNDDRRKVQFSVVEVREYDRMIGDHPDVREGPPMSISWKYEEREPMHLHDYELSRFSKGDYHLSSSTRKLLLRDVVGISEEEIRNAEKEVQRIQAQRNMTARQGKAGERKEFVMESARRKLRRTFSRENF
jgi:hypothetical protein